MDKSIFIILLYFILQVNTIAQNIPLSITLNQKADIRYSKAKKIEVHEHAYFGGSKPVAVTEYIQFLNKNNLVISEESLEKTKFFYNHKYTIDSLTGLKLFHASERWDPFLGHNLSLYVYHYDQHGFHIGVTHYSPDTLGRKISKTILKVNERGHPIDLAFFDSKDSLSKGPNSARYLYNQNQYILTHLSVDGKKVEKDTLVLNPLEDYKFKNPNKKFNQQGDLLWESISRNSYKLYEYKYDQQNNWLEKKEYIVTIDKNGKKKKKSERFYTRKIEYWKE
ncbi:hypothetical protein [Xanthocytophaga agilis]|uniref:Uncharacterized protein n=1 Tax=Xanthocytophaga agilis TaxID=3048010 RepID=A0AAE3R502_9BACT|nr:hypothetical protein [Xanthocytophaga agilis]MDJ1503315.1 hypothetical protein [Xanthocytophaga agilis]